MRKLMIALAMVAGCLLPLVGHTLGLGDIEVNSALNQELNARIKLLSAVPEDTQNLIVKLATSEEFNQAGIDRPYLLQSLKFTTEVKGGVPYIKVTSTKPIREPFLNFLMDIDWPNGHLMREYTILLDPPVFTKPSDARPAVSNSSSRPGTVSAPPAAADETSMRPGMSTSAPAGSTEAVASSAQTSGNQTAPAPAAAHNNVSAAVSYTAPRNAEVRIKKGDTAWSMANAMRPDQSISTEQMMVALLRTNPESFIEDNVNGLKRGYILRVPDRSEITKISQSQAVAMVRKQNSLWRQYQQNLNGGSSAASAMNQSDTDNNANGSSDKSNAHLAIVSAGKGAGAAGNVDASKMSASELRSQLALMQERLESERLEKENLKGEVGDLKKQVDKMKRLLSIEDSSMAEMQSTADKEKNAEQQPAATETETEADQNAAPADEEMPAADETAAANTEAEKPAAETSSESETKPESTDQEKVFVDNKDESQPVTQPQNTPAADEQTQTSPQMPAHQPPGLLANILGNPLILGAIGAGVLLLIALGYMIVRRRRDNDVAATQSGDASDDDLANVADMLDDQAVNEDVSDEEVETSMAKAEGEAEEFDSDATMVLPSANDTVVTQAQPEEEEEEARDDVIAEADVYLAYGIYQQAEELLQNAIKEHPDNDAYRMKLAETYFAGKNASGFGELAAEMHKRTNGSGGRWQKLVAMGKELIPGHELFQGASADSDVALDDIVPSPEPMDIDLGLDDTRETSAPDLDFSLDDDNEGGDNELELPDTTDDDSDLDLSDDTPAEPLEELEFDLSETEAAEPEAEASESAEDELSLDFEASDLGINTDEAESEEDNSLDFDLDLNADAGTENEAETETADEPEPAKDSDDADEFDIDVSEELGASATIVTNTDELTGGEDDIDLSSLDDVDEVSTKLDLARAYLDMGDNEGTRSILEEVVAEGNAEQKAEAEKLLEEING